MPLPDESFALNHNMPSTSNNIKRELTAEDIRYMQKIEKVANEQLRYLQQLELREEQEVEHIVKKPTTTATNKLPSRTLRAVFADSNILSASRPVHHDHRVFSYFSSHTTQPGPSAWRSPNNPAATAVTEFVDKEKVVQKKKKKKIQKKKKTTTPHMIVKNETTERMKEFIVNEMKGTDVRLVIQKTLYTSDVNKGLNRLNMPINQLQTEDFLTADEKRYLDNKDNYFEVPLLGPTLEVYKDPMKLKKWHMTNTMNYVLMNNWYKFIKENKARYLKENSKIQVWSFRRDKNELCFAIVGVEIPDGEELEDDSRRRVAAAGVRKISDDEDFDASTAEREILDDEDFDATD